MIIRLKLLIKDSNTIPKLWVFNVLQRVQGVLICIETFLQIFDEEVTVTESGPSRTIIRINVSQLQIVFNGMMILSIRCAILCKLVQIAYICNVISRRLRSSNPSRI